MDGSIDLLRTSDLKNSDLIIDHVYEGGRRGNAGDDPLNALLGVSNQGGFRILGSKDAPRLIVLTTSLSDPDWPDFLDHETGRLTYFGDNKKPGHDLHGTRRFGNELLRRIFDQAHSGPQGRACLPPVLIFGGAGSYRDMRFLGLIAPGADGLSSTEDLVAIWKTSKGLRFQNYRAIFTVLDTPKIERRWLRALKNNNAKPEGEPEAWTRWKRSGTYRPLKASKTIQFRARTEQEPQTDNQRAIIRTITNTFRGEPVRFERCAGRLAEMLLGQVTQMDITRPSRDGGRDGVGKFRIGGVNSGVVVEFALEAKCYSSTVSVGVKELSRLISRLRHRQFGVLVTTSHVAAQAYQEIKDDQHPIVVIAGRDIAEILERNGLGASKELERWLSQF